MMNRNHPLRSMPMNSPSRPVQRIGVLIKTDRWAECIVFYREALGLEVRFQDDFLCCFAYGSGYLLIEPPSEPSRPSSSGSVVIRLNVPDVRAECERLRTRGIPAVHHTLEWGDLGTLFDPAGNSLELMDAARFEARFNPGGNLPGKGGFTPPGVP